MAPKKSKQTHTQGLSKKLLEKADRAIREKEAAALGNKMLKYIQKINPELRPDDVLIFALYRTIPGDTPPRAHITNHCIGKPLAITELIANLLISFVRRDPRDVMEKVQLPQTIKGKRPF